VPYADEFRTLAEIAVSLAGFTGIVVALERRSSKDHSIANRARLRELLLASLGVVFFVFIPTLLAGAGGDDRWAYRASLLPFAAYQVLLVVLFTRSTSVGQIALSEWLSAPVGLGIILLQLATAVGLLADQVHRVYFLALLWLLLIACINFVVLLLHVEDAA
jgi:O-antigen/teichoic acid export membrane protein